MSPAEPTKNNGSSAIVVLDKFIQATRDSGYKGTASAISELVDNSIQAGATCITICVTPASSSSTGADIEVSVCDNGCGMDPFTLRQALRFGGSTRFGDRSGLGRYGMGLPNASLSQARRVTVLSWQSPGVVRGSGRARPNARPERVFTSFLDVDLIISGAMVEVPRPRAVTSIPAGLAGPSGTLVSWTQCDRLDHVRVSTIVRKLEADLGRRFRHFLWTGTRITINGNVIRPFDPLYLEPSNADTGGRLFGEELRYEICANNGDQRITSTVLVRFSELPVKTWHVLSNEEKRRVGIAKGAGVSIVRAGREVDYGWFFMGSKRRENYDDWWRCEIQFDPVLDEAFGIAHTKQQIRPQSYLMEALTPNIEATARLLNRRARKAHFSVKTTERSSESERVATERNHLLRPLTASVDPQKRRLMKTLESAHPTLRRRLSGQGYRYMIVEGSVKDTCFYSFTHNKDKMILVLNQDHPFYREIYKPLLESTTQRDNKLRAKIEIMLLAAARSEAATLKTNPGLARYRLAWSNTLAAFLNEK
jgi:anti-sigma regulatory factor (Ser/Thr protein kinase)